MSEQDPMSRVDHVMDIANAMLDGGRSVMDETTTSAELFSALVSILAQFVQILVEQGVDQAKLRQAVLRVFTPLIPMGPESKWKH